MRLLPITPHTNHGPAPRSCRDGDRGTMFVLTMLVSVAIVAAVTIALIPFAAGLMERQRAQAAADSAALAGVRGGQAASVQLATANGAALESWTIDGRSVTVTVVVGQSRATARATDDP